jgi:phage shock protein A
MINEHHLEELLFENMKKRDAYKQLATESKFKMDNMIVENEKLKLQIESLELKIKKLEAEKEDLDAGNKFLLKALRKVK